MTAEILVVDADPASIRMFSQLLSGDPELRLGAAVTSGKAALAVIDAQAPQLMLIDLDLPDIDGVGVIRETARRRPDCRSLAFTTLDDIDRVDASIDAGASGCLLKSTEPARIVAAIHDVRAGGCPLCPQIARRVIERLQRAASPRMAAVPIVVPTAESDSPLTLREREILRLTAKGLGFVTIGDLLEISTHTVATHVKKIYRKLSVHSRGEAVYEARQMGWL